MLHRRDGWDEFKAIFPHAMPFVYSDTHSLPITLTRYRQDILDYAKRTAARKRALMVELVESMDTTLYYPHVDSCLRSVTLYFTDAGALEMKLAGFDWFYR